MSYVAPEIDIDRFLPELVEIVSHVNCSDFTEGNTKMLAETLKVELKRAETIMDQMEAAGLGTCYMKEE